MTGRGNGAGSQGQPIAAALAKPLASNRVLVEALIPFSCEVSIVGARTQTGETYCYPLVENVHRKRHS